MKNLLPILLCISVSTHAVCQKSLTNEQIDSLINQLETSSNVGAINDLQPIQSWTRDKGNYTDSVHCIYTYHKRSKKLIKVSYRFPSHNIDETFYFFKNVLVAAIVTDHGQFTSWKNSTHYFNTLKRPAKEDGVLRPTDSQEKSDLLNEMLLDAYLNLDYFNKTLRKQL